MKIHSSPFSVIEFESNQKVLTMVWNKDSGKLGEQEVKTEISRIIEFVRQNQVRSVIVDSRNYAFRGNLNIQSWITGSYIPMIVDSGIVKYAIIVETGMLDQLKAKDISEEEDNELPIVEYFTELKDAQKWIES